MKYLPILQELLASDTLVIFLIGLVASFVIGLLTNSKKGAAGAFSSSLILYALCELISNFHTFYLLEIILVFIGTLAFGAFVGYGISTLIFLIKRK